MTQHEPGSWNDISHVATMQSLVERGTWRLDDSPWLPRTADHIVVNGHAYSDKMPLLSWAGAAIYAVLRDAMGATLAPNCSQTGHPCAYYWLTLLFVGLPTAMAVWLFHECVLHVGGSGWAGAVAAIALGLGTTMLPYAVVFNHHVPAAVSLLGAFYLLLSRRDGHAWWLAAAGALTTLAVAFDAVAAIMAVTVGTIAVVRTRRRVVYFVAGAALPVLATVLLDYRITGTVLPPYLIVNGYNYPGSPFPATIAGNGTPDSYGWYAFHMLVGNYGLFAFNPLLLMALVGAIVVAGMRAHPLRVEASAVALGFVALSVFLVTHTSNYGGRAYGERWFMTAIPLLMLFGVFLPPLNAPRGRSFAWVWFVPLLAISIYSTEQGVRQTWERTPPPVHLTREPRFPYVGLTWAVHKHS